MKLLSIIVSSLALLGMMTRVDAGKKEEEEENGSERIPCRIVDNLLRSNDDSLLSTPMRPCPPGLPCIKSFCEKGEFYRHWYNALDNGKPGTGLWIVIGVVGGVTIIAGSAWVMTTYRNIPL